jgi:CDP-paratose 2-epimerase
LARRGAEFNLRWLRHKNVSFNHGDIRVLDDLLEFGEVDAIVECSADPSVLAGVDGGRSCVVGANLIGAYHCLKLAGLRGAPMAFFSTSRVYPPNP